MGPSHCVLISSPRRFGSPLKFENHCLEHREASWGANLVVPLYFTEGKPEASYLEDKDLAQETQITKWQLRWNCKLGPVFSEPRLFVLTQADPSPC